MELNNIIGSVTKNLTLDSGFPNSLLLSLAQDFRSANLSNIPSYTYPAVNSTSVPGALDPQPVQGQAVIQQWLDVGQTVPASPPAGKPGTTTPATTTPAVTVNPSSVSIEAINGSGAAGQAGQLDRALTGLGYRVTDGGDLPSFGTTTTTIDYAPDSLAAAQQVRGQISGGATLVEDSALTPTPYNLEVVTGSSYTGVTGSAASSDASPTTTTTLAAPPYAGTATVDPSSSSFYHGVYIPPGLEPGQVPRTCGE